MAAAAVTKQRHLLTLQLNEICLPSTHSSPGVLQKSANLVIDRYWRTKVTDFYLTRLMVSQASIPRLVADNMRWTGETQSSASAVQLAMVNAERSL